MLVATKKRTRAEFEDGADSDAPAPKRLPEGLPSAMIDRFPWLLDCEGLVREFNLAHDQSRRVGVKCARCRDDPYYGSAERVMTRRAVANGVVAYGEGQLQSAGRMSRVMPPARPTTMSWISFFGFSGWPAAKAGHETPQCRAQRTVRSPRNPVRQFPAE